MQAGSGTRVESTLVANNRGRGVVLRAGNATLERSVVWAPKFWGVLVRSARPPLLGDPLAEGAPQDAAAPLFYTSPPQAQSQVRARVPELGSLPLK